MQGETSRSLHNRRYAILWLLRVSSSAAPTAKKINHSNTSRGSHEFQLYAVPVYGAD